MQLFHRTIAVILLLGWLFATGHVVAGHGGEMAVPGHHENADSRGEDDHHDAPAPDTHQHDLTATQSAKSAAMPAWVPLYDALVARMVAMLREAAEPQVGIGVGDSPLDERSSGWLLVCRTSLQVRGPSFV